jgi:hypothetical protein
MFPVNFDAAIERLVFLILVELEVSRGRRLPNAHRYGLVAASHSEVPEGRSSTAVVELQRPVSWLIDQRTEVATRL